MVRPRPLVTLKLAQTLDGRIATASGHSRWISGPSSRAVAHELRAGHDAVLVGIGTVLADDPRLTVRSARGPNPIRVVIDSALRIPPEAAVLAQDGTPVKVMTLAPFDSARADAIRQTGATVIAAPEDSGRVDLSLALQELYERGIKSVLVEGGAQIATEIIRRRLMDELVLFIAPKIIGAGVESVGDLGTAQMTDAIQLTSSTIEMLDGDILFRGKPRWDAT